MELENCKIPCLGGPLDGRFISMPWELDWPLELANDAGNYRLIGNFDAHPEAPDRVRYIWKEGMSTQSAFDVICGNLRNEIEEVAQLVNNLHSHDAFSCNFAPGENKGINRAEMHENITLAYRHLEDAASRLGAALSAFAPGQNGTL